MRRRRGGGGGDGRGLRGKVGGGGGGMTIGGPSTEIYINLNSERCNRNHSGAYFVNKISLKQDIE